MTALKHICVMNETLTSMCLFTASRPYMRRKKGMSFGKLVVPAALYSALIFRYVSPTLREVNLIKKSQQPFPYSRKSCFVKLVQLLDSVEENDSLTSCFTLHKNGRAHSSSVVQSTQVILLPRKCCSFYFSALSILPDLTQRSIFPFFFSISTRESEGHYSAMRLIRNGFLAQTAA